MKSPLQIWRHSLGLLIACALFLAGKLMIVAHHGAVAALARGAAASGASSKFFLYTGKFFEVVALVGGFVEAVALMVLTSGLLFNLMSAFGAAE